MSDEIKLTKKEQRAEDKYFKEHTTHIKLTAGDIVFAIINYAFFAIFTLSCIFPFYYIFINTISSNELVTRGAITLIPKGLTIQNYIQMGNVPDLWNSVLITFARTLVGTALMVFISALAGYLVTKKEMWHRQFWYRFLVITMYFNAGLIPWYLNMAMLGLTDTFAAYIIPGIVSPYNIILVKTYIESIPGEIEESAYMDGCSVYQVYFHIIIPAAKSSFATVAIFSFLWSYNDLFTQNFFLRVPKEKTITLLLNEISSQAGTDYGLMAASVVLIVVPVLVVYVLLQKHIVKGLTAGAIKG